MDRIADDAVAGAKVMPFSRISQWTIETPIMH